MTFRQFAINNVLRNKRLYVAYFLSSLFTVMVFFTFAIFAFHPSFQSGDINKYAMTGMKVAGGIIYVFSFFFILYSMSAFLQSRKKEFGLLMMQGMTTGQIRWMIFLENMLIGFFSTLSGILTGLVFAKLILLLAENVLIIDQKLNFYLPWKAILLTFASFIVLFLFISFVVSFILRTNKLIDLIKADKQSKGEPKASVFLSILGALLLIVGYATALIAKGPVVVMVMVPVIVLVVIGTYLLFTQLSVFIIRRLKNNESIFWRKTNMILFSDLSFRMKDNARSFFLVAIISTVAFSAIGALYGTHSFFTKGMKESMPYNYTYWPSTDTKDVAKNIAEINKTLQEVGLKSKHVQIMQKYYPNKGGEGRDILMIKASDYNRSARMLGKKQLNVPDMEAVVAKQSESNMGVSDREEKLLKQPIQLADGTKIKAEHKVEPEAFPEVSAYYIVGDKAFDKLPKPASLETFHAWSVTKGNDAETVRKVGEKLSERFEPGSFQSKEFILYQIETVYGPVLFIGLFIGIVFFVSAGSFLYFRLFTDLAEDKAKFRAIAKMGLTVGEMKKVANRQTALLFFAPMVVALVHGAVALTALSRLFDYNLVVESVSVLASFLVIQIIYFVFVRFFYIKQMKKAIQ